MQQGQEAEQVPAAATVEWHQQDFESCWPGLEQLDLPHPPSHPRMLADASRRGSVEDGPLPNHMTSGNANSCPKGMREHFFVF